MKFKLRFVAFVVLFKVPSGDHSKKKKNLTW